MINLAKTWEKLMLAARIIVAIENPADGTNSGHHSCLPFPSLDCPQSLVQTAPAAMPSTRFPLPMLRLIKREAGKRRSTDDARCFCTRVCRLLCCQCASSLLAPTASALCSSSGSTPVQTTWPAATRPVFQKYLSIVLRERDDMDVWCMPVF